MLKRGLPANCAHADLADQCVVVGGAVAAMLVFRHDVNAGHCAHIYRYIMVAAG